jgi:predicted phage terminase large subunit-like protein
MPLPLSSLEEELLQELSRREAATGSLAGFSEHVLGQVPALHHRYICQAIDELLDDQYDELIILAPPGSAKSSYTSIALPAYFMGKNPTKMVLTASYSTELAEKWGRRVRNTVDSSEFELLFNLRLSQDSTSAGRWANAAGGELYAAGVGSGILGFRADLAIIDDPVSGFEEAQSQTRLAKMHDWYETDFTTRLKPGAKTVLICQRLARNDMAGYLIDRNILAPTKRQRVIKLQMEAGEGDVLGRAPGERLWPEWFTESMVIDAKRDDYKWRTLYQQEPPADDGAWVGSADIQFRPSPPRTADQVVYGMTDLALSVNTGDYTVHFAVAVDAQGDWDIVDARRKRVDVNESATDIVDMCETWHPTEWLIDDDNASKTFAPLVATAARERGVPVPWCMLRMRGQNKETRAAPLRGMYKRHKVYMPADAPWASWLTTELLTFPNAIGMGVDDGIDSLGLMGRRLLAIARPVGNVVPLRRPTINEMTLDDLWEDRVATTSKRL